MKYAVLETNHSSEPQRLAVYGFDEPQTPLASPSKSCSSHWA